jgi:hypothetical protein
MTISNKQARRQAVKLKHLILGEFARGEHDNQSASTVRIGELLDLYTSYLKANRKSGAIIEKVMNANVRPVFGERRAASVTTADLEEYRERRTLAGQAANTPANWSHTELPNRTREQCANWISGRRGILPDPGRVAAFPETGLRPRVPPRLPKGRIAAPHLGQGSVRRWIHGPGETKNGRDRNAPIYGDIGPWIEWQKSIQKSECPQSRHVVFWHQCDAVRSAVAGSPVLASSVNGIRP